MANICSEDRFLNHMKMKSDGHKKLRFIQAILSGEIDIFKADLSSDMQRLGIPEEILYTVVMADLDKTNYEKLERIYGLRRYPFKFI